MRVIGIGGFGARPARRILRIGFVSTFAVVIRDLVTRGRVYRIRATKGAVLPMRRPLPLTGAKRRLMKRKEASMSWTEERVELLKKMCAGAYPKGEVHKDREQHVCIKHGKECRREKTLV